MGDELVVEDFDINFFGCGILDGRVGFVELFDGFEKFWFFDRIIDCCDEVKYGVVLEGVDIFVVEKIIYIFNVYV